MTKQSDNDNRSNQLNPTTTNTGTPGATMSGPTTGKISPTAMTEP